MNAIEPNIQALIVFAAAWLVCCAGAFQLAGHLPLHEVPYEVRSRGGMFLIVADAALLLILLAAIAIFSYRELRWPFTIVVGGMIFLFAPFAIQDLPDAVKNGKPGLVILLVLLLGSIGLLWESGDRYSIAGIFT